MVEKEEIVVSQTEPPPTQESEKSVELPTYTATVMRGRYNARRLQEDCDLYAVPEYLMNPAPKKGRHQSLLEWRENLLDTQIQRMEIKVAEATKRKEEARILKETARQELEKLQH